MSRRARFWQIAPVRGARVCAVRCGAFVGLLLLSLSCGGAKPPPRPAIPKPPPPAPVVAEEEPPPPPPSSVKIKGLTGTLNKDDVHQTMEAQQPAFDACIEQGRRSLRYVNGAIRFAFRVDGEGHVEEVHAVESDVGHRELEQCLTAAVAATQFPKPAGRATARFTWGLTVYPASTGIDEPVDPKLLEPVLRRKSHDVFKTCKARRSRERFRITAYIARDGRVLSAGAVPFPPRAEDKLDCVLEEVASWRVRKLTRRGKISFDLR
jgi:hypothetical protein